jgi:uncharacterized membrane protein
MRQAIAISLFLVGLVPLKKGKITPYCIIIIVAALFHRSAMIMLLLPVLVWLVRRRSRQLTVLGIVIGLSLIVVTPITLLQKVLGGAGYDNYVQSEQYGSSGHLTPVLYICCFLLWFISYRISVQREREKNLDSSPQVDENEINLLYGIMILGLIISVASLRLAILFRLAGYCFAATAPLFANIPMTKKSNVISVALLYAPYAALFIFTTYLVPTWTGAFPYELMDISSDFMFSPAVF